MEAENNEEKEEVKKKVVQLSVQSGVSSSFTAFIAVNKDNNKEIQGPLLHRAIPMAGLMGFAATPCCGTANISRFSPAGVDYYCAVDDYEEAEYEEDYGNPPEFEDKCCYREADSEVDFGNPPEFEDECYYRALPDEEFPPAKKPPRDPLLQLVSLQKASGCWLLDPALAAALGKTNEEVEKSKPEKASSEVWATILALIWLHGFKMDAKDEWELLAAKAVSWLSAQKAPSVTECVEAGNILLGCSVQKTALGL
ncbi:von Willebrand factor A domain-containing protein 5A-like [Simochromis diagramma]|uniref:von Willebrand factor A domain-containing protein 5A-like n=1 Tax=Simochromis diagramma TaxID=43689 RepID=UPI001A7EAC20|nr:von Willebrand factor A domain-containing protein 5A-like [Simochromis diagramma]